MHSRPKLYSLVLAFVALCTSSVFAATTMNGAGSTFIDPIFAKWMEAYSKVDSDLELNYQAIGSLQSVEGLLSHSIDFAASDAPLHLEQLDQPECLTLFFPATLGAVVVIFNIPEIPASTRIKLSGPVLADIFLGKIRKWNDPAIVAVNPGTALPDRNIIVVYRQDGSGTTYTFTDYLSKVSSDWAKSAGAGMVVRWPGGLHAPGNEGVAETVQSQAGGIGYVELTYAKQKKIPFTLIQNRTGAWVDASPDGMAAAADGLMDKMPSDLEESITDAPGQSAYPITSYSYLLFFKRQIDPTKTEALSKFLVWALHDGQSYAGELDCAPLPSKVVELAERQLKQIDVEDAESGRASCKASLGIAKRSMPLGVTIDPDTAGSLFSD